MPSLVACARAGETRPARANDATRRTVSDQLSADLASLRIDRGAPRARSGAWKWLVGLVVLAGLAGTGVALYPRLEASIYRTEVAATEVSLLSPAQAAVSLSASGYVVPQTSSEVGSKLAGKVSRLYVKEGDVVEAGQVLAELEMADQVAALAAAEARVAALRARTESARAAVKQLDQQIARESNLVEAGALGRATLEDLELAQQGAARTVDASLAETRAAEAEVRALRAGLGDHRIVAPMAGTVISRPADVGESVGGPQAAPILQLADFGTLMVEAEVPEGRLALVRPGAPAEIVLDAYPQKRFRGAVHELGKRVNRAKATVVVKVKFTEPAEGVLPDMSSRVSFLTEALSDEQMKAAPKQIVPRDAVVERGGESVVFVIEDGKVKQVPVRLAPGGTGADVELLEGPRPGTRVVSKPPATMADGQGIKERAR